MTSKQMPQNGVLTLNKRSGETPLECLDRLRLEHPEYVESTLSYAGRLDPLASGVLLVLVGDEANKGRDKYLGLQKEYAVEVLFGVSTDTFDVLGLVNDFKNGIKDILVSKVEEAIKDLSNFDEMPYPAYSSKPVEGKSLFQWAREGKIDEISLPKQKGKILSIKKINSYILSPKDLLSQIKILVNSVRGDFRQEKILKEWDDFFDKNIDSEFLVVKFDIKSESGAYMRSFAKRLGDLVSIPALALTIQRTKVGGYEI